MLSDAIDDARMLEVVRQVKGHAQFAFDVLEQLRVEFQQETYLLEAKRRGWPPPPGE